jgi:hypothetical protein
MVLHPEACWGGLPTRVQKTKIYNLETDEFVTDTRHFQKSIWRELSCSTSLRGKFRAVRIYFEIKNLFFHLQHFTQLLLFQNVAAET